jgi:hypothetical protein
MTTSYKDLLDTISNQHYDLDKNSYFINLKRNIPIELFLKSQIPFYYAVENWVNALNSFYEIHKLSFSTTDSMMLLEENIKDEMGNGVEFDKHTETFKHYLKILGWNNSELYNSFSVKMFNTFLNDYVKRESPLFISSMLGAIEYLYIDVSKRILDYLKKQNNETLLLQKHYSNHETLDVKHSDDFFKIGQSFLNCKDSDIERGITIGFSLLYVLYSGLSEEYF